MVARIKPKPKVERVRIARFKRPPPGVYSKAKQCIYCKHWYINPCDEAKAVECANFNYLSAVKKKGKTK